MQHATPNESQRAARAGESDVMRSCWSCRGPVPAIELFCKTCEALQAPVAQDHYGRLGLERAYAIDTELLDGCYFRYQRLLHPDRFATKTAKERAISLQHATDINDAYETLRDPLRRAEYLLSLSGRLVNEGDRTIADPALLTESIEQREALAEADSAAGVDAIIANAEADISSCRSDIATAFADSNMDSAASLTTRFRYLEKLYAEARAARSRFGATPRAGEARP